MLTHKEDLVWLGFNWTEERYSSDYFQQLYDWSVEMIKNNKAYVDSQSSEEMVKRNTHSIWNRWSL
jgi:glutaminyl-tRNA synthetase